MALPFTNRTNELKDLDAAAKAGISRTIYGGNGKWDTLSHGEAFPSFKC